MNIQSLCQSVGFLSEADSSIPKVKFNCLAIVRHRERERERERERKRERERETDRQKDRQIDRQTVEVAEVVNFVDG